MDQTFFDEPLEQSKIKSQIVVNYFEAWARIIAGHAEKIMYVDLFAGPGHYEDGTESTPLLVLKKAIANPNVASKLVTEFNDKNPKYIESLRIAVASLENIDVLSNLPTISNLTVSGEISHRYAGRRLPPSLFFLDPWGYKGLSPDLIRGAIKDWASECLLFFNYDRINRDLENSLAKDNIDDLFGKLRADKLRERVKAEIPYKREEIIIQEFCEALREMGGQYVLPFCFLNRKKNKTSHYLIHITKHLLGYGIMKEIMGDYSIKDSDGVPTYTFDPKPIKQLLLNYNRPLAELKKICCQNFEGKLLRPEIYMISIKERQCLSRKTIKMFCVCLRRKVRLK
jgi:three-Cys-motif partner protein